MTDIGLSRSGPPETIIPPEDPACAAAVAAAKASGDREALNDAVASWPRAMSCWVALAEAGRDRIERYAAYRVGYHRGLDLLRASGWRGSGYVRWQHETNRPFLSALSGLAASAAEIGEIDEAERCELFLRQLDPAWDQRVD